MSTSSEPQFRSLYLDERHVSRAWTAACISALFTLIFAFPTTGVNVVAVCEAAVLAALAYGVWKRSRVCAVLLLAYAVAVEAYLTVAGGHFSILRLVFIYFYLRGAIQLFRDQRRVPSPQPINT